MSVRATNSLIADIVTVGGLPNSPKMVVSSINEETKQVTTVWFSASGDAQTATFPAPALDRVEVKAPASAPQKIEVKASGVKKAVPVRKQSAKKK
jgi:hypothetical protein